MAMSNLLPHQNNVNRATASNVYSPTLSSLWFATRTLKCSVMGGWEVIHMFCYGNFSTFFLFLQFWDKKGRARSLIIYRYLMRCILHNGWTERVSNLIQIQILSAKSWKKNSKIFTNWKMRSTPPIWIQFQINWDVDRYFWDTLRYFKIL